MVQVDKDEGVSKNTTQHPILIHWILQPRITSNA